MTRAATIHDPGVSGPREERARLVADRTVGGSSFGAALAGVIDVAVTRAAEGCGAWEHVAVVALGSYGRRELCPGSDVDVLLLHDLRSGVGAVADALWYPLWDAGFRLGHAVRTPGESIRLAGRDLATLTSLLDGRLVAGGLRSEAGDVVRRAADLARRRRRPLLETLAEAARRRQEHPGTIAHTAEPDLKNGAGGLRDLQALSWAGTAVGVGPGLHGLTASGVVDDSDAAELRAAAELLLETRVALHRATGRGSDVLSVQDRAAVAALAGRRDGDDLMRALAGVSRRAAWLSHDVWAILGGRSRTVRIPSVADGSAVLAAASEAVRTGGRLDRSELGSLRRAPLPTWTATDLAAWNGLLRAGRAAVPVFEALDHAGILERILPEWADVRHRPPGGAVHRFTVDRHLLETVAEAASLLDVPLGDPSYDAARACRRPHVLLMAALLHDIGKGRPGDHSEEGGAMAFDVAARMGFDEADAEAVGWLVRSHLLLVEVATRRDLDDPAIVATVADRAGDHERLGLLYLLTVADGRATGPAAWSAARAGLVRELWWRADLLSRGESPPDRVDPFAELADLLRAGGPAVRWGGPPSADGLIRCAVVARDRTGLLADVAGALTLAGLDVVEATGRSHPEGWALEVFRGRDRFGRLGEDAGRARATAAVLAVQAGGVSPADDVRRLRERYRRRGPAGGAGDAGVDAEPRVRIDQHASRSATVVEVRATDGPGLLAAVASVFAADGLDVAVAKADTVGDHAVDVFYVRDRDGGKVLDPLRLGPLAERLAAAAR